MISKHKFTMQYKRFKI